MRSIWNIPTAASAPAGGGGPTGANGIRIKVRSDEPPSEDAVPGTTEVPQERATRAEADAAEQRGYAVRDRRWWATDGQEESDAREAPKPSFVAELEAKLAARDETIAKLRTSYQAALDDFERAKGRIEKDARAQAQRDSRQVLTAMLEVIDDFDRAEVAIAAAETVSSVVDGVRLVRERLLSVMSGFGVRRIDAEGEVFDPVVHDAVSAVPVDDPDQHDVVVGVIKVGYMIGEETLRPASVAVGRHPSGRS